MARDARCSCEVARSQPKSPWLDTRLTRPGRAACVSGLRDLGFGMPCAGLTVGVNKCDALSALQQDKTSQHGQNCDVACVCTSCDKCDFMCAVLGLLLPTATL